MGLFSKLRASGALLNEIRCDEPSYLIWKWHPIGTQLGQNKRENAIRWGSVLRVKDGEVAVFVYKSIQGLMQDSIVSLFVSPFDEAISTTNSRAPGVIQDFIVGPFDKAISTANLPVLADIIGLAYDGGTPFQAEVYFINLAQIIQIRFGVPFFDVYDPRFIDFGVPVAVRGTISFRIEDYRRFIKLHRLNDFNLEDFQKQIRDAVNRYVKDCVANAPSAHNIPVVQLETKIAQINDVVEIDIKERLQEDFGVLVSGVDIGAIEIDKTSEGYRHLMAVTKDVETARVQAEAKDYAERLRIQREEGQYAQRKQTQSANIGAFQIEKQAEVGISEANALGEMGRNGASGIDLGGHAGFNPAAMVAGMAVGGAVGKNLASTLKGMTSDNNKQSSSSIVPPPVPVAKYHVAVNGQAAGPYDMASLHQMAASGLLKPDSLVWKTGMSQWMKAGAVDELNPIFSEAPPVPPIE